MGIVCIVIVIDIEICNVHFPGRVWRPAPRLVRFSCHGWVLDMGQGDLHKIQM